MSVILFIEYGVLSVSVCQVVPQCTSVEKDKSIYPPTLRMSTLKDKSVRSPESSVRPG
jgi:hypothetical protein